MSNAKVYAKNFKDLKVYQKSIMLCNDIYKIIKKFPSLEKYAMVSQMIRSVTSISANVAEGNGQIYRAKELTFFNNSLGSASELRCWLELARNIGYIDKKEFQELDAKTEEIIKMLVGYMNYLKRRIN